METLGQYWPRLCNILLTRAFFFFFNCHHQILHFTLIHSFTSSLSSNFCISKSSSSFYNNNNIINKVHVYFSYSCIICIFWTFFENFVIFFIIIFFENNLIMLIFMCAPFYDTTMWMEKSNLFGKWSCGHVRSEKKFVTLILLLLWCRNLLKGNLLRGLYKDFIVSRCEEDSESHQGNT